MCHVAPSTLGYLPLAAGPGAHLQHQERVHRDHILTPWIETRPPPSTAPGLPQLCSCHIGGPLTPQVLLFSMKEYSSLPLSL